MDLLITITKIVRVDEAQYKVYYSYGAEDGVGKGWALVGRDEYQAAGLNIGQTYEVKWKLWQSDGDD